MFHRLVCIGLLFLAGSTSAQNAAPSPTPEEAKFRQLLQEAQQFHAQQKFFEALQKLNDADEMNVNDYVVQSFRGSIFTSVRNFAKAHEYFTKAHELNPKAFEPKFNLAELEFVQADYKSAHNSFSTILAENPQLSVDVRQLTEFKVLVCELKQGKVEDAEKTFPGFKFGDNSVAYHFAKASFALENGNKAESKSWLDKAKATFKEGQIAPFVDTLIEAQWLPKPGEQAAKAP